MLPISNALTIAALLPLLVCLTLCSAAVAQVPAPFSSAAEPPKAGQPIEAVVLYPLFERPFFCKDHAEGDAIGLGDALGTDCMVMGGLENGGYPRLYRTDGSTNDDWFGWHAPVLAPFDGVVKMVRVNPVVNRPGVKGSSPAGQIVFQRADGLIVAYAHIIDARVKVGDRVLAGQVVAVDGNNGAAQAPHVHVGVFRNHTPYQIRWDQRAEGKLPAFR